MSDVIIFDRMQQRRGTAANLASVNEVLRAGEICVETDTGLVKIGDGSTSYNSLLYQNPGLFDLSSLADGRVPAWDATNSKFVFVAQSSGGAGTDPTESLIDPVFDLMGKPPTSTIATAGASYPWVANDLNNGGSISAVDGGASAPGVWRLAAGISNATGRAILTLGSLANITLGAGELRIPFRFRVPTLSTGTDRYTVNIGLRDAFNVGVTDGVYVRYTDNQNSGQLDLLTVKAGVTTTASSTTAVAANTFLSGEIRVNAAGTQADLYVGGASVATSTTNIPTAAMLLGGAIFGSSGTAARNLDLDYLGPPQITFTVAR